MPRLSPPPPPHTSYYYILLLIYLSLVQISLGSSAAGTETLIGIVGRDFVLLGADTSVSQSIALTARNVDKLRQIDNNCLVAAAGDAADTDRLVGLLHAHATLRAYQTSAGNDIRYIGATPPPAVAGLSVHALANLARTTIYENLRTPTPYRVALLVAGMDAKGNKAEHMALPVQQQLGRVDTSSSNESSSSSLLQPCLYWLDEYGALQTIRYGAQGLGSNFILSILDQGYRSEFSKDEAIKLMQDCFAQLRQRYVINTPHGPCLKYIDAEGCHTLSTSDTTIEE